MSLVSVIIPNYNGLDHIKETLDTLFDQSYPKLEVIIVDDDSTDGSYEYLSNFNNLNLIVKKKSWQWGLCGEKLWIKIG